MHIIVAMALADTGDTGDSSEYLDTAATAERVEVVEDEGCAAAAAMLLVLGLIPPLRRFAPEGRR